MQDQADKKRTRRIAVVGGGASGMTAAVTAAGQGACVTLYEAKERLGKKLLATGNGKCNYTNLNQSPDCYRGDRPEFALAALRRFPVADTIAFFERLGIVPKVKNGYVYPNSEQAASVADALAMEVRALGIDVRREEVTGLKKIQSGFLIQTAGGAARFDRVILCCGSRAGYKETEPFYGYALAEGCGHTVTELIPALVQLRCKGRWFKTVAGVRCEAAVALYVDGCPAAKEAGEVLFAEYGLSGIPVLEVSRFAGKALARGKTVECVLDLMPQYTEKALEALFVRRLEHCRGRSAEELLVGLANHKLNFVLLNDCGIPPTRPAAEAYASAEAFRRLAHAYKCRRCEVAATNPFPFAQVCAGGVNTEEVLEETMESKRCPGLYFAGELLDLDGTCGGYNLQWAWSSGFVAGLSAAQAQDGETTCLDCHR